MDKGMSPEEQRRLARLIDQRTLPGSQGTPPEGTGKGEE